MVRFRNPIVKRTTFVTLGALSFGLIVLTFVVRGSTRLVVGDRTAMMLSAPIGLTALSLVVGLFVVALLSVTGVRPLDADGE